jgi:glucose/arabinose dehydrogenase
VLALAAVATLIGCSGAPSETVVSQPAAVSSGAGPSARSPAPAAVDIRAVQVATLEQPLAMAVRSDDPALYVAEKTGRVLAVRDGAVRADPVLDLSNEVSLGGEQGLLGLAFSPNGRFAYVNYTDTRGDTRVTEFAMRNGHADPASRREVLFVDQPFSNHNGGNLVFGPDGYLYVGLGDGGSAGDPNGNGQSLSVLLGKMLRIDPRPSGDEPYGIPADNPFVDRPGVRAEIWAYGLRNPWRYSFDRATGDLWIGDVGQSAWEEVDFQPAGSSGGENYGWNRLEGTHEYGDATAPPGSTPPVFEYANVGSVCGVTGGHVYRGNAIPDLYGAYVFADFCVGKLQALWLRDGRVIDHRELGPVIPNLSSFGEDGSGELYAMSLSGGVYKIVPG